MLFNSQAFLSAMIIMALIFVTAFGFMCAIAHRMFLVQVIGVVIMMISVAAIISHVVALMLGA